MANHNGTGGPASPQLHDNLIQAGLQTNSDARRPATPAIMSQQTCSHACSKGEFLTPSDISQRRISGTSTQVSSVGEDDGTCIEGESPVQSFRGVTTDETAADSDSVWSSHGNGTPSPTSSSRVHGAVISRSPAEIIPRISQSSRSRVAGKTVPGLAPPMGHWVSPPASGSRMRIPSPQAIDADYEADFPRHRKRKADQLFSTLGHSAAYGEMPVDHPSPPSSIHSSVFAGDEPGSSRARKQRKTLSPDDDGDTAERTMTEGKTKRGRGAMATKARWDPMTATLNDWITSAIETSSGLRGRKKILENTPCRLCGGDAKHSSPGRHLKTHHRGTLGQQFANESELRPYDIILLLHFTLSFVQNNGPHPQDDAKLALDVDRFLRDYPGVPDVSHPSFDAERAYPALCHQMRRLSRGWNLVCEWCDTVCSRSDALNRHLRTVCTMIPDDVKKALLATYRGKASSATRRRRRGGDKKRKASSSSNDDDDDEYEDDDEDD